MFAKSSFQSSCTFDTHADAHTHTDTHPLLSALLSLAAGLMTSAEDLSWRAELLRVKHFRLVAGLKESAGGNSDWTCTHCARSVGCSDTAGWVTVTRRRGRSKTETCDVANLGLRCEMSCIGWVWQCIPVASDLNQNNLFWQFTTASSCNHAVQFYKG